MEKETEKKVEEAQEGMPVETPETAEKAEVVEKVERTPRELLYERIRTSRPDANYDEDEEEYSRQAMSMMDDWENKSGKYDELSNKLMTRFGQNPEEAEALLDYLDGASLPAAIRRRMGDEALTMKEGDEGWDDYVKAGEDRKRQFDENRAALDAFMANASESDAAFSDFVSELGMDEAAAEAFKDVVLSVANDMSAGRISKETLAMLKHAIDYDKDMASAREQGEIDGKNKKITAEKKRMEGSGLPDASAGGSASEEVDTKPKSSTADWLGGIKRR